MTIVALLIFALFAVGVGGWISNLIYVCHHFTAALTVETIVALIGVVAAPLGMLHGIYTWF